MGNINKSTIYLLACWIFVCSWTCAVGQEVSEEVDHCLDSLVSLLPSLPDGTQKLQVLDELCYVHYNVDSTLYYASKELNLAETLQDVLFMAGANRYLAWCYLEMYECEQACHYYQKAINIYDSLSMKADLAVCNYGLGRAYSAMGDDTKAEKYIMEALTNYELSGRYDMVADVYRRLALIRIDYHLYESSKEYLDKAFTIDMGSGDSLALGKDYYTHGWIFYKQYYDIDILEYLISAKTEMRKGFRLAKKYNDSYLEYEISKDLMFVYQDLSKIESGNEKDMLMDSSCFFYNCADSLLKVCSFESERIFLDLWLACDYTIKGKGKQALNILNEVESRPKITWQSKIQLYKAMIFVYESIADYANVVKYTRLLNNIDKEAYDRDFAVRATSVEIERNLWKMDMEHQKQRYTIFIMLLCLVMMSILAFVMLHGYIRNRKLNRRLAMQNDEILCVNNELNSRNAEILAQRDEIEVQRDNIEITTQMLMDSINYAKHIQNAVVTSSETMHRIFGDTLIYWKPMNVVSGDFYWAMQKDNLKLLVLADCTGHGVPGAFMSMFAISSLNSIVSPLSFENIKASDVLDMLRAKVIGELHQTSTSGDAIESVDMAFCIIDTNKMQVQYAGANRPLLIARDGKIVVYKPDKMPVGLHVLRKGPFTNNVIDLKNGDVLYMATDGLTDQFGTQDGGSTEKFSSKRLGEMLRKNASKPFDEQYEIISNTIAAWRTLPDGTMIEQYDDQLLLGVRIS